MHSSSAQMLQIFLFAITYTLVQGGTTQDIFVPSSHGLLEMIFSDGSIEVGNLNQGLDDPVLCTIQPGFISIQRDDGTCATTKDFSILYGTANQITNSTDTTYFCDDCKLTIVDVEAFNLVPSDKKNVYLLAATYGKTFRTDYLDPPAVGSFVAQDEVYGTTITLQPGTQYTLDFGYLCSFVDNTCSESARTTSTKETFLYAEGMGEVLLTAGFKYGQYDDVNNTDQYLPTATTKRGKTLIGLTYKSAMESGLDTKQLFVSYSDKVRSKRFGLGATAMGLHASVVAQAQNIAASIQTGLSKSVQTQQGLGKKIEAASQVQALNMWNLGHVRTEVLNVRYNLGTSRSLQLLNTQVLGRNQAKLTYINDFFMFLIDWFNTKKNLEDQKREEVLKKFEEENQELTVVSITKFNKGYMITASESLSGGNTGRDCRKGCNLSGSWYWFKSKLEPQVRITGPVITVMSCGVYFREKIKGSKAVTQVVVQRTTQQAITQLKTYDDDEVEFIYTLGLDCEEEAISLNNEAFSMVSELLSIAGAKEIQEEQDGRYNIDCQGVDESTPEGRYFKHSHYCETMLSNEELQMLALDLGSGRIVIEDTISIIQPFLPVLKDLTDMKDAYSGYNSTLLTLKKRVDDATRVQPLPIVNLVVSICLACAIVFLFLMNLRRKPPKNASLKVSG